MDRGRRRIASMAPSGRKSHFGRPILLGLATSRTCRDITRAVGFCIGRFDRGTLSIAALACHICRCIGSGGRASTTGQLAFIANCLPCHRLGGAGEATVGPDLLRPMPATAYFTEAGLRALIRNPAAVRHWPAQQMPAFDDNALSEFDIDAVIAYLHHLAARSK